MSATSGQYANGSQSVVLIPSGSVHKDKHHRFPSAAWQMHVPRAEVMRQKAVDDLGASLNTTPEALVVLRLGQFHSPQGQTPVVLGIFLGLFDITLFYVCNQNTQIQKSFLCHGEA